MTEAKESDVRLIDRSLGMATHRRNPRRVLMGFLQDGFDRSIQRSFDAAAGGSDTEPDDVSPLLRASVEEAVRRTLGRVDSSLENHSPDEDTANDTQSGSSRSHTWNSGAAAPVLSLPPSTVSAPRMATFHALQEWEGYVVSIEDDAFVARLVDMTAGLSYESEEATIPLQELSDHDAANLKIGGIFRWVIGYERSPEGTRKRVSQIVFRDPPRMTEGDLQASRQWAYGMVRALRTYGGDLRRRLPPD